MHPTQVVTTFLHGLSRELPAPHKQVLKPVQGLSRGVRVLYDAVAGFCT